MLIHVVDAFTSIPFRGNPAGVCIVPDFPSESLMQNIAMELGYSNSAFVKPLADNHFHIRWFTPHSEAPLCGHATLATMHILSNAGVIDTSKPVLFESLSGKLEASKDGEWYELTFPRYEVSAVTMPEALRTVVEEEPLFVGHAQNCYFMEFDNEATLGRLSPNLEQLKRVPCRALIATARGDKYDFCSRYFAPSVGINEDPVCASAHCRLIPYWAHKLGKSEMLAYQLSARGGELKCKLVTNSVLISGKAVTIMEATLRI